MLTGEKTSAVRSAALEVDGGLFRWSSRFGKLQTMIPVKRQRRWRGGGVRSFLERQ
jgi:hypothetical protein